MKLRLYSFYLHAKIRINEGIDGTLAAFEMFSTFLCWDNGGSSHLMHCPGLGDSCSLQGSATKSADGSYCVRNGVTVWDGIDSHGSQCAEDANTVLEPAKRNRLLSPIILLKSTAGHLPVKPTDSYAIASLCLILAATL